MVTADSWLRRLRYRRTWRNAPKVTVYGRSLEWATCCPPPRHNFTSLPRIRSEAPAFDLHHPEVIAIEEVDPDPGPLDQIYGDADRRGEKTQARARRHTTEPREDSTSADVHDEDL
ncbi:hypothetical protein [Oerskovia jenensis]|uniref:hypothetical protein n=1 Tax=Oerskovia jenensis TaxID=162169 RepID=UPI0036DD1169